jgi:hypothetical protein
MPTPRPASRSIAIRTLRDHEGRRLRPGDELVQAAGTSHDITAEPGEDVILAARVFVGIEVAPRT